MKHPPKPDAQDIEDGILKMSERLVDEGYRTREEIKQAIDEFFEEKQAEERKEQHQNLTEVSDE